MNLKEAFRYQNKLQSLLDEAQGILDCDANVTKVANTYLRHKVMPEAEDETVMDVAQTEYAEQITDVARFMLYLLEEKSRLFAAIRKAKDALDMDMDSEVSLNAGCPSATVVPKHKGSGMLLDLGSLDRFLDEVFSRCALRISVKTRLGVEKPAEFASILDIYNRYPICELTIHPRVMRQLYRGQADRAAFAASLPGCRMPVCYNGDVTTAADLHTLEAQYPQLSGIMVGRGIIADPALFREARGGAPAAREELRGYLDDLYHGYSELFGSAGCAVSRMKGHWFYLIHLFNGADALEKPLRKAREGWEYEVVVNQLFTLPLL